MPRLAHQDPSEGKALHEALRDVNPVEAEEFKKNVLSPAEIERRKNRKATPTLSRPEVPMSDTALRASLIRLAYQNPNLRADILPLVAKEAGSYQEYVDRKRKKGEKPMTEDAWRSRTQGGGKSESKGEEKSGQPPAEKKPAKSFRLNYRPKMESVMTTYKLTDDDAAQVIQFSIERPKEGRPKTDAQLKQDFLANASPETKARMENMTAADFMIMLRAVLDQEEGGGKKASLRTAAIRFAHENPALRKHVLAAIKEADEGSPEADKAELKADADPASKDQNLASTWEKVDGKQAMDKTAAGPDSTGRNWKEKDEGGKHRWVWAGKSGDPAFTVTAHTAPFGTYYKMMMLLPNGSLLQTHGQKLDKEHWFKRAAQLFVAFQSAAGFDLTKQPEMWKKLAGDKTAATISLDKFGDILDFMMNTMDDIEGKSKKVSNLAQVTGNRGLAQALVDAKFGLRGADVSRWYSVVAYDKPQREMLTKWIEGAGHTVA